MKKVLLLVIVLITAIVLFCITCNPEKNFWDDDQTGYCTIDNSTPNMHIIDVATANRYMSEFYGVFNGTIQNAGITLIFDNNDLGTQPISSNEWQKVKMHWGLKNGRLSLSADAQSSCKLENGNYKCKPGPDFFSSEIESHPDNDIPMANIASAASIDRELRQSRVFQHAEKESIWYSTVNDLRDNFHQDQALNNLFPSTTEALFFDFALSFGEVLKVCNTNIFRVYFGIDATQNTHKLCAIVVPVDPYTKQNVLGDFTNRDRPVYYIREFSRPKP